MSRMPGGSLEARALTGPATTFRAVADDRTAGAWRLLRRPLLLALFFGCVVSAAGVGTHQPPAGRRRHRLVRVRSHLRSAVSGPRLPPRSARACRSRSAVDLFFAGNTPWLLWMIAFAAVRCCRRRCRRPRARLVRAVDAPAVVIPVAAWSAYIDLQFFRRSCRRRQAVPAGDWCCSARSAGRASLG